MHSEYGHVAVASIAVQRVAALRCCVQHIAVQVSDFRSNGQSGVRVARIIWVLDGCGEQIVCQRYRPSMLRTYVHPCRNIAVPMLCQLMFR